MTQAGRALYLECSAPFWTTVAEELARDPGLEPVYWTGLSRYEAPLRERFPSLVFHDCVQAKYGLGGIEVPGAATGVVDDDFITVWKADAQILLDMLSRFDLGRDFSFAERRRHVRRLLAYWSSVLDYFKPDVAIFPNAPHVVYDYIVYRLCLLRGIRTVMWDASALGTPHRLVLTMERFEDGSRTLAGTYRRLLGEGDSRVARLRPGVRASLDALRQPYEHARPPAERLVAAAAAARETPEFADNDRRYLASVAQRDADVARGFAPPSRDWLTSCWKELGVPLEQSFEGPFAWSKFELMARWWWSQAPRRREMYEELATPVDRGAPYVYLPLAAQPERTSNPQGGIFCDQSLVIETVAAAVPPGWRVLVREHPNQLNAVFHGHTCRHPQFYADVAALPNAGWVSLDEDPFDLIDGARAVATIAGSTGWEAVVRGVPALVFGAAWYRECEGVFRVATTGDCAAALEQVARGWRPDSRRVDLFAEAVQEAGFEGLSDPLPADWDLTDEENGRRLAGGARAILAAAPG